MRFKTQLFSASLPLIRAKRAEKNPIFVAFFNKFSTAHWKKLNEKLFSLKIQSTGSNQLHLLPFKNKCLKRPTLKLLKLEKIVRIQGWCF